MMFILIAFILTLLAVLILWWPLKRARRVSGTTLDTFNRELEQEAIGELEAEVARGDLEVAEFARAREDVLRNIEAAPSRPVPVTGAARKSREPFVFTVLAFVGVAVLLFWFFGNWRSAILGVREASHHSLVRSLDHFALHLRHHPDDVAGWKVYARAEIVLGHYAAAAQAYQRLLHLPGNTNPVGTLADYGETLVLEHPTHFDRLEDRIFNRVLEAQPDNAKALWYGGLLALAVQHDVPLALHRFRALLEDGRLPPAFAALVRERIIALGGTLPTLWQPRELRVRVGWGGGPGRPPRLPATLFVYVGLAGGHAPPIWVRRLTVRKLPVTVVLDRSNAMLGEGGFRLRARYRVAARLAPPGASVMGPADLKGKKEYPGEAFRGNPLIRITLVPPERAHP